KWPGDTEAGRPSPRRRSDYRMSEQPADAVDTLLRFPQLLEVDDRLFWRRPPRHTTAHRRNMIERLLNVWYLLLFLLSRRRSDFNPQRRRTAQPRCERQTPRWS